MRKLHWLYQLFPFNTHWKGVFRNALYSGGFVAVFLFLFRPFGMQVLDGDEGYFLLMCLGFGMVTFLTVALVHGAARLFPHVFNEEKWVVWKEILFNLFFIGLIGLGNFIFAHFMFGNPLVFQQVLIFQLFTFAIGAIPAVFGAYVAQLRLERRYGQEARDLSE